MTRRRRLGLALGALGVALTVSSCGIRPLNSMVLPGAVGTGSSGYTVTIQFASAANLVANSEVKVDDVTVGTVEAIHLDSWHADVRVSVLNSVRLPANAVATIGQKSLLGAEYVQLAAPTTEKPVGRLQRDATIALSHSGRYPETEEVLAALSMWLNGGGLANVQTIATEANTALHGNEAAARNLLANLNTFVGTLDTQRGQITNAITAVDRLAHKIAAQRRQLGTAIDEIGPGLAVLNKQRGNLNTALAALNGLGKVGTKVIDSSRDSLLANLRELQPTLAKLVEAGSNVPRSLDIVGTFIAPVKIVPYAIKGDFVNVGVTFDLTLSALANTLFPGTPLATALPELQAALQAGNPLTGPITGALNGAAGSAGTGGAKGGRTNLKGSGAPTSPPPPGGTTPTPSPSKPCDLLTHLLGGC